MDETNLLRSLPSVDKLMRSEHFESLIKIYGRPLVTYSVRRALDKARSEIAQGTKKKIDIDTSATTIINAIVNPSLKQVLNATGVVLHTNLGRAPLGDHILQEIAPVIQGYSNLEFDLDKAARGHRADHIKELLVYLTGAQDAVVVNNNAAAIILILNTYARGKEVIISRGELIEIGGAFRIPEIMESSGAIMVEVGTTNRTRISDYESAITPETALIFKAHKSNYTIQGFTEETSVQELALLAGAHNIPFVYDIGSGLLRKPKRLQLEHEPDVHKALSDGADLVTFSCDKLLGGPQAGVVAGRTDLVAKLARAPLMRALRVGKLTLAALSSACRHYLSDENLIQKNPLFYMLEKSTDQLKASAVNLSKCFTDLNIASEIVPSNGQCGGGTLPDLKIPSYAVSLIPPSDTVKVREAFAEKLFHKLLERDHPILGILREGRLLFDVLTIPEEDIPDVAQAVSKCLKAETT